MMKIKRRATGLFETILFITECQAINPDGIVLENSILPGMDLARVLQVFPECYI